MANYQRTQIPYNPIQVLPFSNRYELTASENQPVNSDQLDGDFNYTIDSLNDLWNITQGIAHGILPGSDDPLNVNKFPITDGQEDPTISWTKITSSYFSAQCIPTGALRPGCVTNPILGIASVGHLNIIVGAIQNDNLEDNVISFDKMSAENNAHFQLFFNTQDNATLSGAKIQAGSLPGTAIAAGALPGTVITPGSLPAAALVANSLTRAQLSPIIQTPIGVMMDWAGSGAAPAGWLKANGSLVSKTTYSLLFAVCGIIYGPGDATNFNLPDARGVSTFGIDPASGQPTNGKIVNNTPSLGRIGGSETVTLDSTQIPPHTHDYTSFSKNAPLTYADVSVGVTFAYNTQQTTSVGGGLAHNNMPPYLLIQKIIYAGV